MSQKRIAVDVPPLIISSENIANLPKFMMTNSETQKAGMFKAPDNVVYKIVTPEELNLKPIVTKRNRVKKAKTVELSTKKPQTVSKTRSGRNVKFPKHIQNDFKKIDVDDADFQTDIKTSDFYPPSEPQQSTALTFEAPVTKKRKIAAQYRCPKCHKAYLGRSKMLEHLRKNPSHGPMQTTDNNHFEVWNYLVAITQKCPSSERGPKFCQELSNLLHNLLLLTNSLFKKMGTDAHEVAVDKVLGNAIGLNPGKYYFDDNNLCKDVTVLQLMGNPDFLNSIHSKNEEKNCDCGKDGTKKDFLLLDHGEDLILPTEPILDNSTSSDEVIMNVDQFVNERFRKFTESDLDPLDLFQFS